MFLKENFLIVLLCCALSLQFSIENCREKLSKISEKSLESKDCCLSLLCTSVNNKLLLQLCQDKIYLHKEQQAGCLLNMKRETSKDGDGEVMLPLQIEEVVTVADRKIRLENITKGRLASEGLQFLDVPKGDDMHVDELNLDDGYLVFEPFARMLEYLLPGDYSTDLLVNIVQGKTPWQSVLIQVLKLESTLIIWVVFWLLLALVFPFVVTAKLCCASRARPQDFPSSYRDDDSSINSRNKCTGNTLAFCLHVFLLLILFPLILIVVANEQLSRTLSQSPEVVDVLFEDVNSFVRNTHMQITFLTSSSMDVTVEQIRGDLEDIQILLGVPFQQELSSETGIDSALDALDDLKTATGKVTGLVQDVLQDCMNARTAGLILQDQIREIGRQLSVARLQCNQKDRLLCYTLQFSGFDVVYSTDNLTNDPKIKQLHLIGSEPEFNSTIQRARQVFEGIPEGVVRATSSSVLDVKNLMSKKRTDVYKATHELDVLARSLSEQIRKTQDLTSPLIQKLAELDVWRWLAMLGITAILAVIWSLMVCGAPCGCGLSKRTIPLLYLAITFASLMGIILCALGVFSLLFGGHGQFLVCKPWFEAPHYSTLSKLFNRGGFYPNGLLEEFGCGEKAVRIEDVLNSCQRNQSAFTAFRLERQLNLTSLMNFRTWNDLESVFENISLKSSLEEILSPGLQLNLQVLSTTSNVNLSSLREEVNSLIVKRDLSSFADQISSVSRQLIEPSSSRKLDNLAFFVRRVVKNEFSKMAEIRRSIIYKVTTLEVLLPSLNKLVNQSLTHLKTIQFFLDHKAEQIAKKSIRKFVGRIESSLEELYNHVKNKVVNDIGRCRPIFQTFHVGRYQFCKLFVEPLNGLAFMSFLLLVLLFSTVLIIFKLMDHHRSHDFSSSTNSHRNTRDGLMIDDEGIWASPASSTPPELQSMSSPPPPPRRPSQPQIPPPPRQPPLPSVSRTKSPRSQISAIASRLTGAARKSQMPSLSRARNQTQESMHLIEPICWKTGSVTPKSWI